MVKQMQKRVLITVHYAMESAIYGSLGREREALFGLWNDFTVCIVEDRER